MLSSGWCDCARLGALAFPCPVCCAAVSIRAVTAWSARLADLPRPLIGVLLGGPTPRGGLRDSQAAELVRMLARFRADSGAGFAISPSRRTPASVRLRFADAFGRSPEAFLWD